MLRTFDVRSDDVCLIVALDVKMLSWVDFLLCTNHKHIHRDCWHKGKSLNCGCEAACEKTISHRS